MNSPQTNPGSRVALTLTQLTQVIGNSVRLNPSLQGAWVTAELSDVRVNGGHCYMELIEKNSVGSTVAKLRATVWANQFRMIQTKFAAATGRQIGSGIKVLLYGSTTHHSVYGLSFSVTDIDPAYTLGDMERLRREILERLHYEGILERNKQLSMPWAPQRIAVISAAGAAGYGDFLNQLGANQEGFVFYPFLFGAVMQGNRTASSVIEALELIEHTVDLWDCVVIIRGGGATTDLNGFDNYELARRVALCPLPVVVGIGHERDRTVLDEIAHTRCKTPTAVAAYLVDSLRQSYNRAAQCVDYIIRQGGAVTNGERLRLHNTESMLPAAVGHCLDAARNHLSLLATRL
ncbi:MAG: exodeoxyribonuclease VII large subunit, partial [Muribaculaceae bacterium]|nr:exodeoxyribonuclease VII large subunit [Muribaculaceae bacterium]